MTPDYKKIIAEARQLYFSLPKKIFCPSLKSNVLLTRIGWEHLINKKDRTLKQSYFRVKHLHLVPQILKEMPYFQSHTVLKKGCNEHQFWSFQVVIKSNCLEVVVRQTGNQAKHFYSIVYKGRAPRKI